MSKKHWWALGLFVAAIVALDQITKALTVAHIPLGEEIPLIPEVLRLTYVRNTGAAFSMLGGARWFFLVLVAVFLAGEAWLIKKKILTNPVELWALAAVTGGAIGNAIDRALTGEVVDMIEPLFVKFAVFNVADCFITCGAILLAVYVLFFERKHEDTSN